MKKIGKILTVAGVISAGAVCITTGGLLVPAVGAVVTKAASAAAIKAQAIGSAAVAAKTKQKKNK